MAKRPRVPAALYAELTEYSSLLRALRTSDTLDLASHLIRPPPPFISQASLAGDASLTDDDDDDDNDHDDGFDDDGDGGNGGDDYDDGDGVGEDTEEALDESPPTDSPSQDAFSQVDFSSQSRGDDSPLEQRINKRKAKQRDTWTRWPLLAGDVHVPEWGLADEVKNIAERVIALSALNQRVVVPEHNVEETPPGAETSSGHPHPFTEQDDHTVPDVVLHALTADSAAFLSHILALATAHVPAAEKSMQNRITPISWETVVNVACAHGVVSPRVAEVVRARMSRLFPPAQPDTIHRTRHLLAMKQRTSQLLSKHDDSILDVSNHIPDAPKKLVKRKRGLSKKRAAAEAEAGPSTAVTKHRCSEDG